MLDDLEVFKPDLPFMSMVLRTTLSNHAPIIFGISHSELLPHAFTSQWYLNTSFLDLNSMKAHILQIWNLIPCPFGLNDWIHWWNGALCQTSKVLRYLGVEFAKEGKNLVL